MDMREEHPEKQPSPKLVTEDGILMDVREEQPPKQHSLKLVTEDGILMDVREEHPLKQYSPKLVTEDGITVPAHPQIIVLLFVSITALQFFRESYTEFPASTTMDVREEQS